MKITKNQTHVLLTLLGVILIIYSYRWILAKEFDPIYFKHFYDHSQWSIANSPRIMGDGELYQYAGYSLLTGDNPFVVNPEVPPLGKYMYALAIKFFNNSFAFNFFLYCLVILLFQSWISRTKVTGPNKNLATLLFATSPLLFNQIGDTGLDLLYLIILLGFWIALYEKAIIFAGIFLGLFISTKFGLFALAPLTVSISYLGIKNWKKILTIVGISGLVYVISYSSFFIQGHSLSEWLQTQKWIINFYAESDARKDPVVFFTTALMGLFKWENTWEKVNEWSILWPLGAGAFVMLLWGKRNSFPREIATYARVLILIFLVVPFAVRYMLLLLPVLVLCLVVKLKSLKGVGVSVLVGAILLQAGLYIHQGPERQEKRINELLSANRFDDLYSQIQIENISRAEFSFPIHQFLETIEVDESSFKIIVDNKLAFSNKKPITFTSEYETSIGSIAFSKAGFLELKNGKWVLVWDWEFIAPHFSHKAKVEFQKGNQVGGKLITSDEKELSNGVFLPFISLHPERITNEAELLTKVKMLTGVDSLKSRTMVHVDHPSNLYRRISFVKPGYDLDLLEYVSTQSGVLIENQNGPQAREYAQGVINNKLISITKDIERQQPELKNFIQGNIVIKEFEQEFIIYQASPTGPKDVRLKQNASQLFGEGSDTYF